MDRPFLTFTVRPEDDGRTLAGLLRTRYGMSRGLIRRLKKPGCALADGEEIPMTGRVRAGQVIALYLPAEAQSRVRPEPQPLAIVYEDRDLLVVEKPAGVLVHPSGVDRGGTLVNGVAHYLISRGEPSAAGPVTRLDRDTSGLVLFAKHPHAHHRLCVALAAGKVQRRYLALAEGDVQPDEGAIEAPIRRAPGALTRRAVLPGGQPARTYYRVLGRYNAAPVGLAGRFSHVAGATAAQVQLRLGVIDDARHVHRRRFFLTLLTQHRRITPSSAVRVPSAPFLFFRPLRALVVEDQHQHHPQQTRSDHVGDGRL